MGFEAATKKIVFAEFSNIGKYLFSNIKYKIRIQNYFRSKKFKKNMLNVHKLKCF